MWHRVVWYELTNFLRNLFPQSSGKSYRSIYTKDGSSCFSETLVNFCQTSPRLHIPCGRSLYWHRPENFTYLTIRWLVKTWKVYAQTQTVCNTNLCGREDSTEHIEIGQNSFRQKLCILKERGHVAYYSATSDHYICCHWPRRLFAILAVRTS